MAESWSYWCLVGSMRLGLDQERALEPDAVLVLGDQAQEPGELVSLAAEVRVEQRVIAFAAAPQHVVRAAEPLRRLEHGFTCAAA